MADQSTIEWTDATWNPVTGCTKISPGCDHCYAERFSERFRGVGGHPFESGFDLTLRPERIEQPLSWKRPRMIFVNSMSDLFHKDIPTSFIDRVFDTMERANWHVFQVLTKRSSLMRRYVNQRYRDAPVPGHIWLGVSVEDAARVSRIKHLQETNATIRFLSVEPMIGPVGSVDLRGVHWVIAGGESGPRARPIEEEWVCELRNQCGASGVAFFFKQWGGKTPKAGGRTLQGREWNEFPKQKRQKRNFPASALTSR
jgi:protein gp37